MTPQEIDALVRRLEQSADKVRHTRYREWAALSDDAALALRSLLLEKDAAREFLREVRVLVPQDYRHHIDTFLGEPNERTL